MYICIYWVYCSTHNVRILTYVCDVETPYILSIELERLYSAMRSIRNTHIAVTVATLASISVILHIDCRPLTSHSHYCYNLI